MVRSPSCETNSVIKKGIRIVEEDAKTPPTFVLEHGSSNWTSVPKKTGVKRYGKSYKPKLNNYMEDVKNQTNLTSEEEDLIIKLHAAIGSRWSIIAQQLPGRTDNDVKNNWNTKLKKKLSQMGIDPITHKPFSQLISDYGNIHGGGSGGGHVCSSSSLSLTSTRFSWNDILRENHAIPPPTINRQLFSKDIVASQLENVTIQNGKDKFQEVMPSSSHNNISFLEAILDQQNYDMFLSFPELLEEPTNY